MKRNTIRILLVDSSQKDARIMKELLMQIPNKIVAVTWVANYDRAMRLLTQKSFAVCLSEYRIGKETGIAFLKALKKTGCPVPVIILTHTKTLTADLMTMRHGAADYLVKDYMNISLLERSIRYAVERQKAETERMKLLQEQTKRIEAEAAQKRVTLLSDASKILATTLNYNQSLSEIARILVPHMADWCIIDILGAASFERLSVIHKDPQKKLLAEKLRRDYPPDLTSPGGVGKVLRTGIAEVRESLDEDTALQTARNNPELLKLLRELGMGSYMMVPILSRGDVLGCLTLNYGESRRQFTEFDLLFIQDLAQRIALAVDNALLFEQAKEGIRIRDEFLNIASHELKTPLTSLQLQVQLLSRSVLLKSAAEDQDRIRELLAANVRQIQRLTKLVNNLLDVSRFEAKLLDLEFERADLTEILREVIEQFSNEVKAVGTAIRMKRNGKVVGTFDRFKIGQVVSNLVSNAIKYGNGKPVEVEVKRADNVALIVVRDYGIGIPSDEQKKIFSRFERTDMTRNLGGLGLGLYIVSRIVTAHKGTVQVESKPTKGSTFTVSLPLDVPNKG